MTIGARLREERERIGLNQTAFAALGGVLKGAQIGYESDKSSPSALHLSKAAETHGVDVLYVITGRREPRSDRPPAKCGVDAALAEGTPPAALSSPAELKSASTEVVPNSGGRWRLIQTPEGDLLAPQGVSVARPLTLPVRFAGGAEREYVVIPSLKASARAGSPGSNPVEPSGVMADVAGMLAVESAYMRRALGRDGGGFISVRVSGDSMEPALHDGDIIVVDTQRSRVDVDGIYVVQSGDDLLVKRIQRMLDNSLVLRSDNPAYPPQTVQAGAVHALRIIGRMVRLRIG